jgi:hypothetical protein
VIEGKFEDVVGAKAYDFLIVNFGLVVRALHNTAGK